MKFKFKNYINISQFLIFILIFFKGSKALELCRQYSIGSLLFNSFYCIDYCCGNCNFRYCCSNETYLVDQNKCTNTVTQPDILKTSQNTQIENLNNTKTTIQASTSSKTNNLIYTDTCEAYPDNLQAKKCPTYARFCCGTCSNRYCCEYLKDRLNQFECRFLTNLTSPASRNTSNPNSYLYVILILVLVLILAFACIPFVIFINKRSKKVQNTNSINRLQNIIPLSLLEQLNTSGSTLSEMPKVSTVHNEDSPPAYSTIFN